MALLLRELMADERILLSLVVGGAHLAAAHGKTVSEIEVDGLPIAHRLDWLGEDPLTGFGHASGRALQLFYGLLKKTGPAAVVLYGDRHELLPLATACVLERVPMVHLCGGDVTEGALDEQVRHAVSKLAHLHFVTSERSGERLRQMGEEPWRVQVVGDPLLDAFVRGPLATLDELAACLGFLPDRRTLLVTMHPTTLEPEQQECELEALATVLERHSGGLILTAPAPDPGFAPISERWQRLVAHHPCAKYVESLGGRRYRAALFAVGAMVGNSSSGLTEAPCAGLPVINIGTRQAGRDRADNVLDVPSGDEFALHAALQRVLDPGYGAALRAGPCASPYGDGHSNLRIIEALAQLPARARLLVKRFVASTHVAASVGGGSGADP